MKQRKVKTYTTEFKQSSAKLAAESGQPVFQIAIDYKKAQGNRIKL